MKETLKELYLIDDERFNLDSPTIYWDKESYVHIVCRHLLNLKIEKIKKSVIPYLLKDLQVLIHRIVNMIYSEWQNFSRENPAKNFSKYGAESLYYNGNYYVIHIEPDGRIVSFYNLD